MRYTVYFPDYKRPRSVQVEADGFDDAAEKGKAEFARIYPHVVAAPGEPIRVEKTERIGDDTRVREAYQVISRSVNGGPRTALREELGAEHSTLLGILANEVLDAVRAREHDGRLCDLNARLADKAEFAELVSDVRQRLI